MGRELSDFAKSGKEAAAVSPAVAGGLGFIAGAALAAAVAIGQLTISLGESLVKSADWRNRTEGAFRVLLRGDQSFGGVEGAFQRAGQFANRFGLDVREVTQQMTQLTAAGFSQVEIPRVLQAAGDLGSLEGPQAAGRAITAIRQIRAKGMLQMEELSGQLADTGLNVGDVISEIARRRNLRGSTASINNQVRGLISARKVNAQEGIESIMGVIANRSGGRLGATMDTQSRGATAAMNRLSNSWLLLQSNFAKSAAFKNIIGFIERMASALDPGSESARRFSAQIDRFFTTITGAGNSIDPVATFQAVVTAIGRVGSGIQAVIPYAQAWMSGFFRPVLPVVTTLVPMMGRFFSAIFGGGGPSLDTLRQIAGVFGTISAIGLGAMAVLITGVGLIARALAVPFNGIRAFWGTFLAQFKGVEFSFFGIGSAIVRGIYDGIVQGGIAAIRAAQTLAGNIVTGVRSALQIQSPSKVFERIGGFVSQGFTLGIEGGSVDARGAVASLTQASQTGSNARGSVLGNSRGAISITVNVTAPESSDAPEWGAAIASAITRELSSRTERSL
jgi:hypothetical protein